MSTLQEKIETRVREWDQWSRAEMANLDPIVEEVMNHVKNGTGNLFIERWCNYNLADLFPSQPKKGA